MDLRGFGRELMGMADEMAGGGSGLLTASEGLIQRRRLDNSLVGKLDSGRRYNGEAWGSLPG